MSFPRFILDNAGWPGREKRARVKPYRVCFPLTIWLHIVVLIYWWTYAIRQFPDDSLGSS